MFLLRFLGAHPGGDGIVNPTLFYVCLLDAESNALFFTHPPSVAAIGSGGTRTQIEMRTNAETAVRRAVESHPFHTAPAAASLRARTTVV